MTIELPRTTRSPIRSGRSARNPCGDGSESVTVVPPLTSAPTMPTSVSMVILAAGAIVVEVAHPKIGARRRLDEDEPIAAHRQVRGADPPRQLDGVGDTSRTVVDDDKIVSAAGHLRESQRILFRRLYLPWSSHRNFHPAGRFEPP